LGFIIPDKIELYFFFFFLSVFFALTGTTALVVVVVVVMLLSKGFFFKHGTVNDAGRGLFLVVTATETLMGTIEDDALVGMTERGVLVFVVVIVDALTAEDAGGSFDVFVVLQQGGLF